MKTVKKSSKPERPAKRQSNGQSNVISSIPGKAKRSRQSNGISSIPDDVLVSRIFIRLPARSVPVVRLVCKSWYSLTKSPRFILSHARQARKIIVFGSIESTGKSTLYNVSLDDLYTSLNESAKRSQRRAMVEIEAPNLPIKLMEYVGGISKLSLSASCDGLLCFDFAGHCKRRRNGYIVCNPLTKEWLNISKEWLSVPRNLCNDVDDGLIIAFYFHASTGEYRLLRRYETHDDIGYEVFSISRSSRAWRPVNGSSGTRLRQSRIPVLHENVYFLSEDDWDCVVAFDTNNEKFRKMSLPPLHPQEPHNDELLVDSGESLFLIDVGESSRGSLLLIEVGGSLGLCQTYSDPHWSEMDIWCLKDYNKEEWVKQYTVSVGDLSGSLYRHPKWCTPLAICEDGKELLLKYDGCFALYNFESRTFKKRRTNKLREYTWVPHIESLVSCNSNSLRKH